MHGCSLLSALPAITHEMAQRLDAADETVSEEILRTVGNLARYALSAQSTPRSSMAKALSWQCPYSAPVPPQGAPGGSGQLGILRQRPEALGGEPLPRGFELAASKAAHSTAADHLGGL